MKMEFSAGGLVYRSNCGKIELLLIRDAYNEWTFPKGHIEKKEKPLEAAELEIFEETGLEKLENPAELKKIDYWFKDKQELIHKYVYYFAFKSSKDNFIKIDENEIKEARFFSLVEAKEVCGYKKDNLNLIRQFEEKIKI